MNALQRAIDCYSLSTTERDVKLGAILSNPEERKIVELWLKNNPVNAAESPILTDLSNRLVRPNPSLLERFRTVLHRIKPTPAEEIERKILAKNFQGVLEDFKKAPEQHIDLIKTHFSLQTLPFSAAWLGPLIDHAGTEDLLEVLSHADSSLFSSLTPAQALRISEYTKVDQLPPYAQEFHQIVQNVHSLDIALERINEISGLTENDKAAAIAYYMESKQIALIDAHLKTEQLLRIAPFMRYVDLSGLNVQQARLFLQNCSHVESLIISDGKMLEGITSLPCRTLECKSPTLTALPQLPLCRKLVCNKCPALKALPALPHCQTVECAECHALTALPALPVCQTLECDTCSNLRALPLLPLCQKLNCSSCWPIKTIQALPLCTKLDCSDTHLESLPELPVCETVYCHHCISLTSLPKMPLCQLLDCKHNPFLNSLPALPFCKYLSCVSTGVTSLPQLPQCTDLYCQYCLLLTEIPPLPQCQNLNCSGCPLAELPEVPWNANVITADEGINAMEFSSLDVDLDRLAKEPKALLLLLGDHLLQNKPFPNIYYFEKGKRNDAVDCGGVRRDFVTKLCLNLFKQLKLEDNFPVAVSDEEEKAYRTLGNLMARCYPATSYYKTGPLFDPGVYRCMRTPDPGSDEWFLTNYLQLVKAPPLDSPQLSKEELTTLAYLVEPDAADISKYTQNYFNDRKNREALRSDLIKRARQDTRLKAISWMAQEMRKKVPQIGENLQERVEGVLNKEELKRKLAWKLTDPKFKATQEYLTNWIDTHEEQLEKFVYAVTGIRRLCANNLKIEIYDRDKNFIPIAHTCDFSLELSGNYESQEVFNKKLEYFLENALAGSGFTTA